jgi:hypothetical protein
MGREHNSSGADPTHEVQGPKCKTQYHQIKSNKVLRMNFTEVLKDFC